MNLVMTVLCRNEEDIIGTHIAYHLQRGVDFVIATDNASEDATPMILEEFRRQGRLHLIREPALTHDQAVWVTRMARLAAEEFAADWVIHSDADEFWWPLEGNLEDALERVPAEVGAAQVFRHNFVPRSDVDDGAFHRRMTVRQTVSLNSMGEVLPPKICHRGAMDIAIADGNHSVSRDGQEVTVSRDVGLEILHFPLRSYRQFENKIRLGTEALERNPRLSSGIGKTWRYLYHQYYRKGLLRDYYEAQVLSETAVEEGLRKGELVIDTRLRDHLDSIPGVFPPLRTSERSGS
jgi:glycosyl transferase family 2